MTYKNIFIYLQTIDHRQQHNYTFQILLFATRNNTLYMICHQTCRHFNLHLIAHNHRVNCMLTFLYAPCDIYLQFWIYVHPLKIISNDVKTANNGLMAIWNQVYVNIITIHMIQLTNTQ